MKLFKTERPDARRIFALLGATLFVLAVAAVAIGWFFAPSPADTPQNADHSNSTSHSSTATDAPDPQVTPEFPASQLGRDGYVPMRETTDPREAAAAAAAVLWSVDSKHVQFAEDFRHEALARVMQPAEEYVGACDQLTVRNPAGGADLNGDDLIQQAPSMLASMAYSPAGWWWRLGDENEFTAIRVREATVLSQPIRVYDTDEIQEIAPGASWTDFSSSVTVNVTKPGATLGLYWVRVETTTTAGDESAVQRNPVALAIYCDPPEDGGICGVASLMTGYPSAWQRQ